MLTDEDINKLSRVFVTKSDFEQQKEELLNHYDDKSDRILSAIDSFAGEIKDHLTNHAIHQNQHDKIVERLDKMEKVSVTAHELK